MPDDPKPESAPKSKKAAAKEAPPEEMSTAAADAPAPPAVDSRPLWWRVMETKKVSLGGVVTQFNKDMVLNAAHYSHEGIAAIRRAGLPLQATEKPEEYG